MPSRRPACAPLSPGGSRGPSPSAVRPPVASSQSRTGEASAPSSCAAVWSRSSRLELVELPARGGGVDELGQARRPFAVPGLGPAAGLVAGERRQVVAERDEAGVVMRDGAAGVGPADRRVLGRELGSLCGPAGLGERAQADAQLAEGGLRQAGVKLRDGLLARERCLQEPNRVEAAEGGREHHPVLEQEAQPPQGLPAGGAIGQRHAVILPDRLRRGIAHSCRSAGRAPRSGASGRISRAGEPA